MNEGISKEAREAARDAVTVYSIAVDHFPEANDPDGDVLCQAFQTLINSTLDRAAITACNALCSLESNDHIAEAILALKDTPHD